MVERKSSKIIYYVIGIILSIFFLLPLLWGFMLSFKDSMDILSNPLTMPTKFDFSLYVDTFKTASLGTLFINSIISTTVTVAVALLVVFISSYAIARLTLRGSKINNFFYYLFLAATSVPIFSILMTTYQLVNDIGKVVPFLGTDRRLGLVLPYVANQIPFLTLVLVGGLKSMPRALEEAAIIDGCDLKQDIFRIVLPTIKPVFATAFILVFLTVWNGYFIASVILTSKKVFTIPLAMSFFKSEFTTDYAAMLRAIVIMLVPQLAFYLIFQKNIVDGMATAGIK